MSELATIPYGQYRKGELKPIELNRVAAFWKEYFSVDNEGKPRNAAAFPYPSFENWAAMTSYDRDAEHGGPGFQNLMRLLLCGVTRASGTNYNEAGEKVLAEDTRYISENTTRCAISNSNTHMPATRANRPPFINWFNAGGHSYGENFHRISHSSRT